MKEFIEGRLRFRFGDTWRVEQYDKHSDYRNGIQKLKTLTGTLMTKHDIKCDTRAVDFVGMCETVLLFIEVTDIRGHRIETKQQVGKPLAREVAIKVRDTIAGIIGAHRTSSTPETWRPLAKALTDNDKKIMILLWLEEDGRFPSIVEYQRHQARRSVLTQELKRCLRWLSSYALVVNLRSYQETLSDVQIISLSGHTTS